MPTADLSLFNYDKKKFFFYKKTQIYYVHFGHISIPSSAIWALPSQDTNPKVKDISNKKCN